MFCQNKSFLCIYVLKYIYFCIYICMSNRNDAQGVTNSIISFVSCQAASPKTIYDFTCNDIDGNPVSLEKYRLVSEPSLNCCSPCPFKMNI